jgi:carbonic anhydrase
MTCSFKTIYILLVIIKFSACHNGTHEWCYRNPTDLIGQVLPSSWYKHYPQCGGNKQSPINVVTAQAHYEPTLSPISIKSNTSSSNEAWLVSNNGHTVKLESNRTYSFAMNATVSSFLQMHLHWRGSEHKINNRTYAGELHLLYANSNSMQNYTVIGFFLEVALFSYRKISVAL